MSIGSLIGIVIALILVAIGAVLVYDARLLTEKWFSFGDQNSGARTLKVVGFMLCIIGCAMLYLIGR